MATRKAPVPTIHYGWMPVKARAGRGAPMRTIDHKVAVSIRAANGEKLAPITQGAQDKRDAKRIKVREGKINYLAAAIAQRRDQVESLRRDDADRLARLKHAFTLLDDFSDSFQENPWNAGIGGLRDRPNENVVIGLPDPGNWSGA